MRADGIMKLYSLDSRGKFGRGGGFGRVTFSYNFFGFYSIFSGIYSKKYYFGEPYISKMKFYRPTNPRTERQQNWRAIFATGKTLWDSLSAEEKEYYRKRGRNEKMTGYNFFMSNYLKQAYFSFV